MRIRSRRRRPHLLPPAVTMVRRLAIVLTGLFLLVMLVVAVVFAISPRAPLTPPPGAKLVELEAFFERLVTTENPPSVSISVVKGDSVVYQRSFGFADAPAAVRATPETRYRWWSLTKLLTAIAVLQLQEQGLLDLEDEVSTHLPFVKLTYRGEPAAPVKIIHLLNHSSGLRNLRFEVLQWTHVEGSTGPSAGAHLMDTIERYSRLRSTPGRRGYYSNYGYLVLGAIIEKVSNESYETYVATQVLAPLGMDHTSFELTDTTRTSTDPAAIGCHPIVDFQTLFLSGIRNVDDYVRSVDKGRIWLEPFHLEGNAFGGVIGPVSDAALLLRAFLNEGRVGDRPALSPETVRKMLSDGWVRAGSSSVAPVLHRRAGMQHGLGWWVFPSPDGDMYQHTGAGPGFATILQLYPKERLGIAVLANGTSLDREGIASRLYELFGVSEDVLGDEARHDLRQIDDLTHPEIDRHTRNR